MSPEAVLQRLWYGPRWRSLPLWPLGWLYGVMVAGRSALYRRRVLPQHRVGVPVVIVGNLTVGGTGKTPVAAWLAGQLGLSGRRVRGPARLELEQALARGVGLAVAEPDEGVVVLAPGQVDR